MRNRKAPAKTPVKKTARTKKKPLRGFAAMDPSLVRELARKGGVAAHRIGAAHEFTKEEAIAAGRKGGFASHKSRTRASRKSRA